MADITSLFACAWGDIKLYASQVQWDGGRTQVVHELASGDFHPIQDRGQRTKRARVTLMFDDFPDTTEDAFVRFQKFQAAVDDGERRLFTHPVNGSFFARVGDLTPTLDEHSVITATCEFVPDEEFSPVAPVATLPSALGGASQVSAAADKLDQDLNKVGRGFKPGIPMNLDFTLPIDLSYSLAANITVSTSLNLSASSSISASASAAARAEAQASAIATANATARANASAYAFASAVARASASASVLASASVSAKLSPPSFTFAYGAAAVSADARLSSAAWTDGDTPPTRQVLIDVARISNSLSQMIELGGFEHDLKLWPAYRSTIMLGEAIRTAAIGATSDTPTTFTMRVVTRSALLPAVAQIYGGRAAQARAAQIIAMNDIKTPGWLDPGDYVMPGRR